MAKSVIWVAAALGAFCVSVILGLASAVGVLSARVSDTEEKVARIDDMGTARLEYLQSSISGRLAAIDATLIVQRNRDFNQGCRLLASESRNAMTIILYAQRLLTVGEAGLTKDLLSRDRIQQASEALKAVIWRFNHEDCPSALPKEDSGKSLNETYDEFKDDVSPA